MNIYMNGEFAIDYRISPDVSNEKLNELFSAVREDHTFEDMSGILKRSLLYICAFHRQKLVGFVYLVWDGGEHVFVLGTIVHPDFRRRGIGVQTVKEAIKAAAKHNIKWIHVDFEPHLQRFYDRCGFRHTNAGVIEFSEK